MHGLLAQVQTDARSLGRGLGGKEGIENLVQDAGFDADAVVVDLDGHAILLF